MNNDTCNCPKCGKPAHKSFEQTVLVFDGSTMDADEMRERMMNGTLPTKTMLMTECLTCGNHSTEVIDA